MANLQSAEGITRYLRSKDTAIDQIVNVSNSLLDGEINVYLPNKNSFVFELVIDRLNDNKTKKFRTDHRIWDLLNKTWLLLEKDHKARAKSLQSFKFGDAVSFSLANSTELAEISRSITDSINLVRLNLCFNNLHEYAIDIIANYLIILNKLDLEESELKQRIKNITQFFKSAVNVEKHTKNFVQNFVTIALPTILETIDQHGVEADLTSLIKRVIFNKEQSPLLLDNVDALLKTNISSDSIVRFFKLAIDTVSKTDITTSEEMFTKITAKLPQASERLFQYISNTKRTLSQPLLLSVFDQEFQKESQNWNLIRSVLQLDIEVALQNAEKILINLDSQSSPQALEVTEEILHSFIRARDVQSFFNTWRSLLENGNKIVKTSEFSDLISTRVNTLSFSQLKSLVESILEAESSARYIILNSIVFGIFSLKDSYTLEQSKALFVSVFLITDDDDELWKLKFQLLSLYEDILSKEELFQIVSNPPKNFTTNVYHTYFRLREIVEYEIEPIASSFVKYTENNHKILQTAFSRWFVLINTLFTKSQIRSLVNLLLEEKSLIFEVLKNDTFFEQPYLTQSLVQLSLESLQSSFNTEVVNLLNLIPIQCYPKWIKDSIIDLLTEHYKENPALDTIIHLLETPTFKTKVETELSTVITLISEFPKSQIFELVWNHHIKNIKTDTSLEFINEVVLAVQQALTSTEFTEIIPEFYLAFTILSNQPKESEKIGELQQSFIHASKSLLNSYIKSNEIDYENVSWLLNVLFELDLDQDSFNSLEEPLKKFGKKLTTNPVQQDPKLRLFLLLSKYSKFSNSSAVYFEALYIVLREEGVSQSELLKGLTLAFRELDQEQSDSSFVYTLDSLSDSNGYVLEIISAYWKSLKRTSPSSIPLFIKSLSSISEFLSSPLNEDSVLVILDGLREILIEKSWILTQYGTELILSILSKLSDSLSTSVSEDKESLYVSITLTLSNILLFHRYRLSNRHHLVLAIFNSLLLNLSHKVTGNTLSKSVKSAQAFSRLLSNLCEPSTSKESSKDSLNSTAASLKRSLRKHVPVLLLSYIQFSLKYSFQSEVNELILPGIFNIFDVLSKDELVLISTSLDYSGRTYYRSLYDDYKKVGKWQTS